MRVTVIDYKAATSTSCSKALRHLGAEPESRLRLLRSSQMPECIVLPGVGHFQATERLDATGIHSSHSRSHCSWSSFLGICVGMQWLYAGSSEAPNQQGSRHFADTARASRKATRKSHTSAGTCLGAQRSRLLLASSPASFVIHALHKAPVTEDTAQSSTDPNPLPAASKPARFGVQFQSGEIGETRL